MQKEIIMDEVQKMYFEILKKLDFPTVSGEQIVADLYDHPDLWNSVIVEFKWEITSEEKPGLFWHLWSIHIFTVSAREDELYRLVDSWKPQELDVMSEKAVWHYNDGKPFETEDYKTLANPKLYFEIWWDKFPHIPADTKPDSSRCTRSPEKE
jgi:hypothetical protein